MLVLKGRLKGFERNVLISDMDAYVDDGVGLLYPEIRNSVLV